MARLTSNKLLPVLGSVILLTTVVVGARSLFSNDLATPQPRTSLPAPTEEPDGDTPADTIRTLNAKLEEVNQRLESVVGQNEGLQQQNEQLRGNDAKLRSEFTAELEQKLTQAQEAQTSQFDTSVGLLGEQLEALKSSLTAKAPDPAPAPTIETASDYPVSDGFGASSFGNQSYVWVQPLDAAPNDLGAIGVATPATPTSDQAEGGLLSTVFSPEGEATPIAATPGSTETSPSQAPSVEPYFTINNLATLAGSTAFTALIGRVPIGGQVSDPVPFRVLVGRENLAASGLRVPNEIASMVFEGVAIGDWTLGCVEGSLRTATFVFEDGTIRTVRGGDGQDGRLGYIADRFGTPCLAGERVSNAGPYLAAAVGLAAGAGAAEAFAAAETAQVVDDGAVVSAVVGDAAKFALGRAASEGVGEIQRYLADRLSSTFDAVFVPPGAEISLLIQQEISIDYDPSGRRLDYAKGRPSHHRALD